jgi:serine phosphatase RsbU (regulator of sigma subunit)
MEGEQPGRAHTRPALSRFLQAIVEAAREGVVAVSPDRRVLAVNRRFCDIWRLPPDAVRVGEESPALGQAQRSQIVDPDRFEAAIVWGHEHPHETQLLDVPLVDGRVIEGYAAPIIDDEGTYLGRVWYMHDDTERRVVEQQKADLLEQLREAQRVQRFLLDASAVLARTTGFAETLEALAHIAVPALADICVIDIVNEQDGIDRIASVSRDPVHAAAAALLAGYPPDPHSDHPSAQAIRYGETRWSATLSDEQKRAIADDDRHIRVIEELGVSGFMSVPFNAGGRTLGAITFLAASERRFGAEDVALAEDLAGRVALVAAKELRYDLERKSSHALQASLLPAEVPRVPGLEVAVRYLPGTRDAEVGGDFWDIGLLGGGEVALAVGDVAGHDITAAATMAQLRSVCRALRPSCAGPAELIGAIQSVWDQLGLDRVATAVFIRVRPGSGALRMASAGHPPPLVVEPGRAWFIPVEAAPPFGAPAAAAAAWESALPVGAALVCYTDGLVEDRQEGIDHGMQRLLAAAESAPSLHPDDLADHILSSVPGAVRADDVALMVVQRVAGTSETLRA